VWSEGSSNSSDFRKAVISIHDVRLLAQLVQGGAQIDSHDQGGITPFLTAVQANNEKAVAFLLDHGVDINEHDNLGRNALHFLAENPRVDLLLPDKKGLDTARTDSLAKLLPSCGSRAKPFSFDRRTYIEVLPPISAHPTEHKVVKMDRGTPTDMCTISAHSTYAISSP
jgi:hypothetical protein